MLSSSFIDFLLVLISLNVPAILSGSRYDFFI
ncbi:hypothetical protein PANA5342_3971 [Pantoea ananatis LMG 5342]|nr:hypothetical protein PANA5342_3971 [Pantoea ananatis LMG 5342]